MDPFVDLRDAGRKLSSVLSELDRKSNTVVVGIVTGGVPVAAEVAATLKLPLEILLLKRLMVTSDPLQPACAFDVAGTQVIDEEVGPVPRQPVTGLEYSILERLAELTRRRDLCRGSLPPTDLTGMDVLLVDNGIRTGSTILAATRALRRINAGRIFAAVPVANPEVESLVEGKLDRLVSLHQPKNFGHVGLWFQDFTRPTDGQIRELLDQEENGWHK